MFSKSRVAIATLLVLFVSVTAAQAQPDHLQCHKIKDSQRFKFADVALIAAQSAFQMPDVCTIKGKAKKFCVPVEKAVTGTDAPGSLIGAGPDLSAADYLCYKMKCPKIAIADTLATDQFGERDLLKIKTAQEICVPAVKGAVATSTTTTTTTSTTTTTVETSTIDLAKLGTLSGSCPCSPGNAINYTFQVTNAGTTILTNVTVTDPLVPVIACPSGNPIPTLAPSAIETCTGSYSLTQADLNAGIRCNTATASGQDPGANPVSDIGQHCEEVSGP